MGSDLKLVYLKLLLEAIGGEIWHDQHGKGGGRRFRISPFHQGE